MNPLYVPDTSGDYVIRLIVTDIFGEEGETVISVHADDEAEISLPEILDTAMISEWEAVEALKHENNLEPAREKISASIGALNEIIDIIYSDNPSETHRRQELMAAAGYLESAVYCDKDN